MENRRVIVGSNAETFSSGLVAENVHWIYEPEYPARLQCKIRYGPRVADCKVKRAGESILVEFDSPQRAVTAGQSVVFYDGVVRLRVHGIGERISDHCPPVARQIDGVGERDAGETGEQGRK